MFFFFFFKQKLIDLWHREIFIKKNSKSYNPIDQSVNTQTLQISNVIWYVRKIRYTSLQVKIFIMISQNSNWSISSNDYIKMIFKYVSILKWDKWTEYFQNWLRYKEMIINNCWRVYIDNFSYLH